MEIFESFDFRRDYGLSFEKTFDGGFQGETRCDSRRSDSRRRRKQSALAQLTSIEAKVVGLDSEKSNILKNAEAEAESEKTRIERETESNIIKLREQTDSEIERLAQQSKSELRRFSANESIRLAEEKIKNVMNSDTDSRLVKASIQSIGGLN